MDLVDQIKAIASHIPNHIDLIKTEEATKVSLVMPIIQALGYNVFDINEVVPEFDANVGASKKYKLDYAIFLEGDPIILIECKHHTDNLLSGDAYSQLFHYFAAVEARIGVLTNGIFYHFYSDLVEANKMDKKPFLEIDMLNIQESLIDELKKLSKQSFDIGTIVSTASELKYTREIKRILVEELNSPSDDFIRFFASQVHPGRVTERVRLDFETFVKKAFRQFIREQISGLLQSASNLAETEPIEIQSSPDEAISSNNGVVTTKEELDGFHIVKSILREIVDPSRICMRDVINYCGIILDENKRQPICRFYFNSLSNLRLGIFEYDSEGRKERKEDLKNVSDIYAHADALRMTLDFYLKEKSGKDIEAS
ncbi:type I restriction endonuclease [Nodosilinea sp. AN01ver1]|uniref:type I restriction endonuclease n=1 Tax=Nodosilinea sp. AN01ver1 TaxID=3423362 RepID=UPI003D31E27C